MSPYSEYPDFTFCFQYTLLVWVPCCLIILGSPLWIYMLTKRNKYKINISWLIISKTVIYISLNKINI